MGMTGERDADAGTIALDEVEHASRNARGVQDLGEDLPGERRFLGRLEHHGAAGGQCGEDLHGNLVHRPVPRCDQAADADRLLDHQRGAALFGEGEVLEHFDRRGQMSGPELCLKAVGQCGRRAHFLGQGRGEVAGPLGVHLEDVRQDLEPVPDAGRRPAGEGPPSGRDRPIHIGRRAYRDPAADLLGRRIHHVHMVCSSAGSAHCPPM